MSGGKQSQKLLWLEAGRGAAAVAVVVSHAERVSPIPFGLAGFGAWGVSFFFVLSGFIIAHVHTDDIGRPSSLARYVGRRCARIFPVYWLILPIAIGFSQLRPAPWRPELSLWRIVQDILLLPGGYPPLLEPAWTLRHELIFYGLFGLLLTNRRVGAVALTAWLMALVWHLIAYGPYNQAMPDLVGVLFHQANLYFFAGLAVCWTTRAGLVGSFTATALLASASLFLSGFLIPGAAAPAGLFGSISLHAGIVGTLILLSLRSVRVPTSLVGLGASSYALYLFHLPLFWLLHSLDRLANHPLASVWLVQMFVEIAAAICVAAAVNRWIDRPAVRWLNARMKRPPSDVVRAAAVRSSA